MRLSTGEKITAVILVSFFLSANSICFSAAKEASLDSLSENYQYPFGELSRDPLSPLISRRGRILIPRDIGAKGLILKGIIYSPQGENSIAIISDELLREKDKIGEYTVFKIKKGGVILKKNKEEIILKLEEE